MKFEKSLKIKNKEKFENSFEEIPKIFKFRNLNVLMKVLMKLSPIGFQKF